jgi:hypothetical protein
MGCHSLAAVGWEAQRARVSRSAGHLAAVEDVAGSAVQRVVEVGRLVLTAALGVGSFVVAVLVAGHHTQAVVEEGTFGVMTVFAGSAFVAGIVVAT